MSVKARRVGNSNVFTIPQNIKPEGEYDVYAERQGSIIYYPKRKNIFE